MRNTAVDLIGADPHRATTGARQATRQRSRSNPAQYIGDNLRAILLAQIESARHRLLSCRVPTEGSIHAVRKTLKRARATLRLLRPSLAEGTFRRANARLRDAAAVLRAARDAKVLLDTVLRLLESEPHSARPLFDGLARMLARERTAADRALLRDGHGVAWGVNVLKDLTAHVQHWRTSRADSACVVAALRRTYKKTRKAAAIAGQQRTDATLHEWRKQLKYLVYELQLLQPLRPKYLGRRLLMARRLAELLGIDHDLAVLRQKVSLKAARAIPRAELSAFVAMLDRRRLAAQMKSYTVGRRLFAQTPRRLVHRLRSRGALARTLTAAYAASRRARSSSRESAGPVFPTT